MNYFIKIELTKPPLGSTHYNVESFGFERHENDQIFVKRYGDWHRLLNPCEDRKCYPIERTEEQLQEQE